MAMPKQKETIRVVVETLQRTVIRKRIKPSTSPVSDLDKHVPEEAEGPHGLVRLPDMPTGQEKINIEE